MTVIYGVENTLGCHKNIFTDMNFAMKLAVNSDT